MTVPTQVQLCTEGLQKAGFGSGNASFATLLTRAQTYWFEEIKQDIYTLSQELRSLMKTYVHITIPNQARYDMPADYEQTIGDMMLMDAVFFGTCKAAGTSNTLTLDTLESATSDDILGREVVIYAGTGANQYAQCIAYNATTKLATFEAGSFTTLADNTSKYFICSDQDTLDYKSVAEYDLIAAETSVRDEPESYTIKANAGVGEFLLYPAPQRTDSNLTVYGIKHRYFANIILLSDATLLSTLYQRWRNIWTQGIFAKALQDKDDNRAEKEMGTYYTLIKAMIAREAPLPEMEDFIYPAYTNYKESH